MKYTSAGLPNGGATTYFQLTYDQTLSDEEGRQRMEDLQRLVDGVYEKVQNWFQGVKFQFNLPIILALEDGD